MELKSIGQNPDTLEMLQMENPLYVAEFPTNEELDSLPKIRRAQIEMTRFIGRRYPEIESRDLCRHHQSHLQEVEPLVTCTKAGPRACHQT